MNRDLGWALAGVLALLLLAPALWIAGEALGHIAMAAVLASAAVAWLLSICAPVLVTLIGFILVLAGLFLIFKLLADTAKKINVLFSELGKTLDTLFAGLANKIESLFTGLSRTAKEAAIDTGFMTVLALLSAAVAYQVTDDFLEHTSTIKMFAIAALGYAILKVLMLIPVRSIQVLSGTLTLAVLGITIGFLVTRHRLFHQDGLQEFAHKLQEFEYPRKLAISSIFTLSAVSLLYPFTLTGWKRITAPGSSSPRLHSQSHLPEVESRSRSVSR